MILCRVYLTRYLVGILRSLTLTTNPYLVIPLEQVQGSSLICVVCFLFSNLDHCQAICNICQKSISRNRDFLASEHSPLSHTGACPLLKLVLLPQTSSAQEFRRPTYKIKTTCQRQLASSSLQLLILNHTPNNS